MADALLTPPAIAGELTLTPPQPVVAVSPDKVGGMVPMDQGAIPGLDKTVVDYVEGLTSLDPHSPEFATKANSIRTMGDEDIKAAANVTNRMLQAPVRDAGKSGVSDASKVSTSLVELRRTIEDLDPSRGVTAKKLLGKLPFGNKLRDYFARFESAQSHLDAIIHALYDGQDELRKDNASLDQEKLRLWETMGRLAQYIYVAQNLDAALVTKIAEVEASDADRARVMREDLLFYVRQKHQDLLTQLAVSIQAYLAIDVLRKNNTELIKGVDRATTTTVSALRTAVIVAQALANQKLVLDQVSALNTTTSNLIESTSRLLATQSVSINEQAASSTIGIEKLQAAFTNIYQTMDAIDRFKVQALDSMAKTVATLEVEVAKSQAYLGRARRSDPGLESGALELPSGG